MNFIVKKEKGITFVALAVTIIVLLILSGITITVASGDNEIINKVKDTAGEISNTIEYTQQELDKIDLGKAPKDAVARTSKKNNTKIQTAIDEAEIDKKTQIFLLKDIKENVIVQKDKHIALYLEKHSLTNLEENKETIIVERKITCSRWGDKF